MNEPDLLNLQIGDVLYRKGATTPCVVACTKPEVVVVASAVVTLADCADWDRAAFASAVPKDKYQLRVSLVEISPDGNETARGDTQLGPEFDDLNDATTAFQRAATSAELTPAAS